MDCHATADRPGLYFTIVGEPPLKMLRYQQQYSFFDPAKVNGMIRFSSLSEEVEREMTEIRAQPDLMARLAKLSGGQSFPATAANPKNITATFANKPEDLVEYQRRPLWDKAWLLGTLLGLLAVEWSLRRWKGLA